MRKPATKPRTTKPAARRQPERASNDLAALGTNQHNGEPDPDVNATTWAGTPDDNASGLDGDVIKAIADVDPHVINSLTPKQTDFVRYMLQGIPQTEAARRAGYREPTTAGTITKQHGAVAGVLAAHRSSLFSEAKVIGGITLGSHLMRLGHLSHAAEDAGEFGAAITAETNRGKASGLYVHKTAAEQAADEAGAATSVLKLKAMMDRVLKRGGK